MLHVRDVTEYVSCFHKELRLEIPNKIEKNLNWEPKKSSEHKVKSWTSEIWFALLDENGKRFRFIIHGIHIRLTVVKQTTN